MSPPTIDRGFNWAILAPGRIAAKFAKDLALLPASQLYGVAGRNLQNVTAFANANGAKRVFLDTDALLADPNIDAVYIASPHALHYEQVKMALRAKKAVLCEKPLTLNAAQSAALIQLAQRNNTFLMEALWSRFLPHIERVRQLIVEERILIGPLHLTADFGFDLPFDAQHRIYDPNLGGGALLDVGIYPAFMSYLLFGAPDTVQAKADFTKTGVDASIAFELGYKNGNTANLKASINLKTATAALVKGGNGHLSIASRFHEPCSGFGYRLDGQAPVFEPFDYSCLGYKYEIEAVQAAVQAGRIEHPAWCHADSLALSQLLDRIRTTVGLKYPDIIEAL